MRNVVICSAAAFLAASTAAHAGGTYSMAGTGSAEIASTAHEVAEGHMIINALSNYSALETEDAENPLNGASGPCFGAIEVKAPEMKGEGHCVYTDGDGDIAVLHWITSAMNDSRGPVGEWHLTGGSGKYAGASGGGGYSVVSDYETKTQVNTVTGEITLP